VRVRTYGVTERPDYIRISARAPGPCVASVDERVGRSRSVQDDGGRRKGPVGETDSCR